MPTTQVVPGLHLIPLGQVNAYLLDSPDGCAIIDAGFPRSAADILKAVAAAGRTPADVKHLVVTHAHPDHIGSLAELKWATGAAVYCHSADAEIVHTGTGFRPMTPAPGLVAQLVVRLLIRPKVKRLGQLQGTPVDHKVNDGDVLPIAGGLTVLHTPGHCAGHVALLWHAHGGVLVAGDAAGHVVGLDVSVANEDLAEARRSLRRLGGLDFAAACFGHGRPITTDAAGRFRQRWPAQA